MANSPDTSSTTFQPTFKRVAQQGRHDDTFAVIAMLAHKPLDAIFRQAESLGVPKTGPYYPWIDGDLIAKLLVANGLLATVWKECASYSEVGEIAICFVDKTDEVGRCVLYHRNTAADGKAAKPYVIDPYSHAESKLHIRVGAADINALSPSWYIGVKQMAKQVPR